MLSTKKIKASPQSPTQLVSSSSADMIASNDDILTLILHRLPLKSLLKFKTVSKHWLCLITHPTFRPHHNSRAISGLFVCRLSDITNPKYDFLNLTPHSSRAPFKSLTFIDDPSGIKILQSCNGLLLCCSFRSNRLDTTYYTYNPTTKHYTVLPPPRHSSYGYYTFGVGLAFDPSKSPHYKVICIRNYDPELLDHYQVEIYSSKTGPWRPSGRPFVAPSNLQFENGVFWNGAIHWVSDWGDSLCFDVEEEQMRDIPMPSGDGDVRLYRYFGESGDHLHLVEVYGSDNLQFDVYEMERDRSGWFVKYQVDLNPVAAAFPEMVRGYADPIDLLSYAFSILCVVHEETDEGSFMVLHLPNKAIRYNFKDNSFRKLHDFAPLRSRVGVGGDSSLEFEYFDAYQFIESFACV
ncbi:hypothetical protein Goshw_008195 [Gossypium schwendimanii]|uniref:F-box domain-containing protein n=1 Tax=Gossypium schwendimanii TaxID=34291 RepID=A0A7J9N528_GOSSC|nr:hypothetical protein [Gossypium schwendimanii]